MSKGLIGFFVQLFKVYINTLQFIMAQCINYLLNDKLPFISIIYNCMSKACIKVTNATTFFISIKIIKNWLNTKVFLFHYCQPGTVYPGLKPVSNWVYKKPFWVNCIQLICIFLKIGERSRQPGGIKSCPNLRSIQFC